MSFCYEATLTSNDLETKSGEEAGEPEASESTSEGREETLNKLEDTADDETETLGNGVEVSTDAGDEGTEKGVDDCRSRNKVQPNSNDLSVRIKND